MEEGQFIVTDGASIRRGIKAVGLVNWGMVEDAAEMVVPEETSSVPTVHYSGSPDIGSAANRLFGEVVQSRRRPLLGPSPG